MASSRSLTRFLPLLLGLIAAAIGWLIGRTQPDGEVVSSSWYLTATALLLAVGLLSSTLNIEVDHLRQRWKLLVVAVTLGVVLKAALVTLVMLAVLRSPSALVLGIAVAQIDPLSAAVSRSASRLSEEAKSILAAWASFDDPVTVVLTIYVSAFTLYQMDDRSAASFAGVGSGLTAFGLSLVGSVVLVGVALLLRPALRGARRGVRGSIPVIALRGLELAVLIALVVVTARLSLFLGLAVCGLVLHPATRRVSDLRAPDRLCRRRLRGRVGAGRFGPARAGGDAGAGRLRGPGRGEYPDHSVSAAR